VGLDATARGDDVSSRPRLRDTRPPHHQRKNLGGVEPSKFRPVFAIRRSDALDA
jgi:hypothetical protein